MSVDRKHADRIAHLARLRLEDEELARITADLNRILEHVESLAEMDAEAPTGHLATSGAPTVAECASTRGEGAETPDVLARDPSAFAPDWREGFFAVPPLPGVHDAEGA